MDKYNTKCWGHLCVCLWVGGCVHVHLQTCQVRCSCTTTSQAGISGCGNRLWGNHIHNIHCLWKGFFNLHWYVEAIVRYPQQTVNDVFDFFLWCNNFGINNHLFLFLCLCKDSHRLIDKGESSQVAQAGAACGLHIGTTDPDASWYTTGTAGQGWQDLGKKTKARTSTPNPTTSISQKATNTSKTFKSDQALHNDLLKSGRAKYVIVHI